MYSAASRSGTAALICPSRSAAAAIPAVPASSTAPAGSAGRNDSLACVITASVPSLPVSSWARSYPVLPAVSPDMSSTTLPSASTAVSPATCALVGPYLIVWIPPALVAIVPPTVAESRDARSTP